VSSEESDFTALDAYMRGQLSAAAETYASNADIDARLQVILAFGQDTALDDIPAVDS
jgi:hypothetical protein